jgi:hypothetical protein
MTKYTPYQEQQINKFINLAEARANAKVRRAYSPDDDERRESWNHYFHRAMDELTARAGLRQHRANKWS